ncbi:MAG: thermonuclease family protein [Rhizobiaceae bacterium]
MIWDLFPTLIFLGVLVFLITWLNAHNSHEYTGKVWVIDGDTIVMDGEKLRLQGIDAPELSQQCFKRDQRWACGRASKQALMDMLQGAAVNCSTSGIDRYDRWLAECFVNGRSINAQMVSSGWAVDYGGYGKEERKAREAKHGVWQGTFESPQEWRRANRGDFSQPSKAAKRWWHIFSK